VDNSFLMQKALDLAAQGWPNVQPNPMVGCVIVHKGEVVSSGFHEKFGEAHAEVNAINHLSPTIKPEECTLFVTLEPCSHFGKTPPCADLIVQRGFNKVVICNLDPNPLVAGKGIKKLRNAGVEVVTGVLEKEGLELNKRFFTFYVKKRPYYILKWAQTADGFISRWPVPENRNENLIGDEAQQIASHQLRAGEMAIMVGKNTALWDNPELTTRLVKGKNPIRIVLDRDLEVPKTHKVYNNASRTIILNASYNKQEVLHTYLKIDFGNNFFKELNSCLHDLGIQSVIVEGGAKLLQSFIDSGNYDETKVFTNTNLFFGNGIKAPILTQSTS
jgi:diaminohydroxyphosphoribosylaminopyrimidine deaminase/5-amino-6-(5-phosphoribosylamino)uracil reductase